MSESELSNSNCFDDCVDTTTASKPSSQMPRLMEASDSSPSSSSSSTMMMFIFGACIFAVYVASGSLMLKGNSTAATTTPLSNAAGMSSGGDIIIESEYRQYDGRGFNTSIDGFNTTTDVFNTTAPVLQEETEEEEEEEEETKMIDDNEETVPQARDHDSVTIDDNVNDAGVVENEEDDKVEVHEIDEGFEIRTEEEQKQEIQQEVQREREREQEQEQEQEQKEEERQRQQQQQQQRREFKVLFRLDDNDRNRDEKIVLYWISHDHQFFFQDWLNERSVRNTFTGHVFVAAKNVRSNEEVTTDVNSLCSYAVWVMPPPPTDNRKYDHGADIEYLLNTKSPINHHNDVSLIPGLKACNTNFNNNEEL